MKYYWDLDHFRGVRPGSIKQQLLCVILHDMKYYKDAICKLQEKRLKNIGALMFKSAIDGKELDKYGQRIRKLTQSKKIKKVLDI